MTFVGINSGNCPGNSKYTDVHQTLNSNPYKPIRFGLNILRRVRMADPFGPDRTAKCGPMQGVSYTPCAIAVLQSSIWTVCYVEVVGVVMRKIT